MAGDIGDGADNCNCVGATVCRSLWAHRSSRRLPARLSCLVLLQVITGTVVVAHSHLLAA